MFVGLSEKRGRKENQGRVSWLEDILLGFVSDHRVVIGLGVFVSNHHVMMILWGVVQLQRPFSLPECRLTSVPANSGTPYVLFSAKVMLKFSVNFSMTLLKIGHMGYLRLMHGPGYLST